VTAASVLDDAGFDFAELDDEGVTEATSGPLTGSRGTRSGSRSRRKPAKAKLDGLQKRLSSEMFQAGAMVGMGLPVTGYYACQESDAFTKAVVQLAARRPEWVDALEHLADVQPGIVIGRTAVGLGAAIAVDRGRADPEKKFMQFLGVYSAWTEVQGSGSGVAEGNAYTPPPAASFQPL
jgi:hypothetical protein